MRTLLIERFLNIFKFLVFSPFIINNKNALQLVSVTLRYTTCDQHKHSVEALIEEQAGRLCGGHAELSGAVQPPCLTDFYLYTDSLEYQIYSGCMYRNTGAVSQWHQNTVLFQFTLNLSDKHNKTQDLNIKETFNNKTSPTIKSSE